MSAPAAGSPPFDFTHLPRAFLDGVIWVLTPSDPAAGA